MTARASRNSLAAAASLLLLLACGKAPTEEVIPEDAGVADAGAVIPLRLVTWNLGDFAAGGEEISRVQAHLVSTALEADVVAVQEIVDPASFDQLLAALPGWSGQLADEDKAAGEHRVGVLWNPAAITVSQPQQLFADAGAEFPRSVLRVSVHQGDSPWAMYVVHLKAGIQADDETKRIDSIAALIAAAAAEPSAVIVGDFNEALSDSRAPEFFGVLADAGFEVATLGPADAGQYSYLPAKLLLDHVAVRSAEAVRLSSAEVIRLDSAEADYRTAVSDHVPVRVTVTTE